MEPESASDDSFGIRKVVDCKIEGGQQMYKVEWVATWEPAEALLSCQHLIDEFWSRINKAKAIEHVAHEYRKRVKLHQILDKAGNVTDSFGQLTEDNKADVQQLIQRTSSTSSGNQVLKSPSFLLEGAQPKLQSVPMNTYGKIEHDAKPPIVVQDNGANKTVKPSNTDGVKYIENFSNPYVKLVVVCKLCNKEQLPKQSYWRQHYLTHSDTKAHQCQYCSKSFSRPVLLRKHVESKHGEMAAPAVDVKPEFLNMKQEYSF